MTETPEPVAISLELFRELSDFILYIPLRRGFLHRLCMIDSTQDPVIIDRDLFDEMVDKIVAEGRYSLAERLWKF